MISREDLESFFEDTRQQRDDGRMTWDIDGVCRWSFFFVDADREKLLRAGRELAAQGYEDHGLLDPSPNADEQESQFLRVDRIERHTVDSLLARNDQLYAFAEQMGLEAYDGMDVGAVDGP